MTTGRLRRAAAKYRLATIATVYLAVLVTAAAAAPLVAPYDPEHQDLTQVLSGPGADHWLGADRLGRDVFSRLLYGGRVTLLDVAEATVVFLVLGIAPGVIAGYRGGWLDRVVVRFADLLLAVPAIVVLLMIVAVFPGNDLATMITLGVIGSPGLLRIVRGSTLAIRGELYVRAARLSGLRGGAILRRHILPRLAGPIIVQASLFCATALLAESGLSFLGLSRPETKGPSWGNMVAEASNAMSSSPWLLVPTGGALMLTVMAFGLVGDAARDSVTGRSSAPRLRNSRNKTSTPKMVSNDSEVADEVALTTSGAEPPTLSVRNLAVALPGPVTILRGVTFDLGPGEAVGIVGESGCGKSITAKAILGLLPAGGAVTAGSARFDGADLTSLNQRALTRIRGAGIGLISQDPVNSLDPTFTVGSQLREVIRRHRPQSRRHATGRALELLRMVRLPDPPATLAAYPHELSGGMAQRVSIALALAAEPTVLIADEPTTALDVTVQAEILALLRDLRATLGMAILLITHDWGVLAEVCDRAVVMYAGEVVETATVEDLYTTPQHPYTRALLAANPHAATPDRPLPAIAGSVPPPTAWPAGCHFAPRCPLATSECTESAIPLHNPAPGHTSRCIHVEKMVRS
jgi:peptide/nickel transport system permease protein